MIYQKTFPDLSDIYKYEETKSNYLVKLYNSENYNYGYIKLNKYNLDILERIKTGNKAIYVLRPDFINSFKMLNAN